LNTVLMAECAGLWRRTLLIEADGIRDTAPGVLWLQGPTAYIDSRGFAGTLHQNGDVFEWHRTVDLHPPGPHPDVGVMSWEGEVLIETGVHENYVEHWVRDADSGRSAGALFLIGPSGWPGLLVRAGELFGWADGDRVVMGAVGGAEWTALGIIVSGNEIQANGARWNVEQSEGDLHS
jgi:hypothetical protein